MIILHPVGHLQFLLGLQAGIDVLVAEGFTGHLCIVAVALQGSLQGHLLQLGLAGGIGIDFLGGGGKGLTKGVDDIAIGGLHYMITRYFGGTIGIAQGEYIRSRIADRDAYARTQDGGAGGFLPRVGISRHGLDEQLQAVAWTKTSHRGIDGHIKVVFIDIGVQYFDAARQIGHGHAYRTFG